MNLYQILTELDSRSKKTAPNIFNEPINCGFEAELIFSKTDFEESEDAIHHIIEDWVENNSSVPDALNQLSGYAKNNIDSKRWVFAHDGTISIDSDDFDENEVEYIDYEQYYGLEIVSPVFPNIQVMLDEMKSLFTWLNYKDIAITNETTGLHVTMSMNKRQNAMMNNLKLAVLASDNNILQDFNRYTYRNQDSYSAPIKDFIEDCIEQSDVAINEYSSFEQIERIVDQNFQDFKKYKSINFKKHSKKAYTDLIEFRSMGGKDYIKERNFHKIENAVKHYAICLKASYSDTYYQDDYKSLLYRLIRDAMRVDKDSFEYDSKKRNPHGDPFIGVLEKYLSKLNFKRLSSSLTRMLDMFDNVENRNVEIEIVVTALSVLCFELGRKNATVDLNDHRIIRKMIKEYRLEKFINVDFLHRMCWGYFKPRTNRTSLDNLSKSQLQSIIQRGFNILFKKEAVKQPKKYIWNVFRGGGMIIDTAVLNEINKGRAHLLVKDTFIFKSMHKNKDNTILLFSKEQYNILEYISSTEIAYDDWEKAIYEKFCKNFLKIYGMDYKKMDEDWWNGEKNKFEILDSRDCLDLYNKLSHLVDIKFIKNSRHVLMREADLFGPDGKKYGYRFFGESKSEVNLYQILTELDSRSKKTAPDIFNEPINCGFEVEIALPGYLNKKYVQTVFGDVGWEDVYNELENAYDGILEIIESKYDNWNKEGHYGDIGVGMDAMLEDEGYFDYADFIIDVSQDARYEEFDLRDFAKYLYNGWISSQSDINDFDVSNTPSQTVVDNDKWIIVDDMSINGGINSGAEIVSPVYGNLGDMLRELNSLFVWLNENSGDPKYDMYKFITNSSTGLHISMSMGEPQQNEMNKLKLCTLAADENILHDFGRVDTSHSQPIINKLLYAIEKFRFNVNDLKNFDEIEKKINRVIATGKMSSVNFRNSKSDSNTKIVEFRSGGGEGYIEEENFHKIENAVKHYAICLKASYSDTYYQDDYKKLLYRLVQNSYNATDKKANKFLQDRITSSYHKYGKHPIIKVIQDLAYANNYERLVENMISALFYKENKEDIDDLKTAQQFFVYAILGIFRDVGFKGKEILSNQHAITIAKLMREFGMPVKDFDIADVYDRNKGHLRDFEVNKVSHDRLFLLILHGYNLIFKQKYKNEKFNLKLDVFENGYVFIEKKMFDSMIKNKYKKQYKDFLFLSKFVNESRTIVLMPEHHLEMIRTALQRLQEHSNKDIKKYPSLVWEISATKEIIGNFVKIYKIAPKELVYFHESTNKYYSFLVSDYYKYFSVLSKYVDVNFVTTPTTPLISSKKLVGPDGTPYDYDERRKWSEDKLGRPTSIRENLINIERLLCD